MLIGTLKLLGKSTCTSDVGIYVDRSGRGKMLLLMKVLTTVVRAEGKIVAYTATTGLLIHYIELRIPFFVLYNYIQATSGLVRICR